jgi:hypothetical protein
LDDNIVAGLHKIISCFLELYGTEMNHPELKQHLQDFAPELLKKHLQSQNQPNPWIQNPGPQRFANTAGGSPLDFPFPPSGAMPSDTNNFSPYAPLDHTNLMAPPLMEPVSSTVQIPPPPANPQYTFNPAETNGMHWSTLPTQTYFDQSTFAPNMQFPQPPHQQQYGAQAYDSSDQRFTTYQPVQPVQPQHYRQMDQQNQAYYQQPPPPPLPQPQPQYHGPQNNNVTPYPQPSNQFGPQQENRHYHQPYPQHGQR